MMKKITLLLIRAYQKTLSPDHGAVSLFFPHGFCRFHPSCSEYTAQSIEKYGASKGLYLGVRRLLRCNPLHKPAIDPIP